MSWAARININAAAFVLPPKNAAILIKDYTEY
jgi:hypothetical protein